MKVTREMIHPELRTAGTLIRTFNPALKLSGCKRNNWLLDRFVAGHARTRKARYEQIYIDRPTGGKPLRLCLYTPIERLENAPCLLWIHGGGYAFGIPETDEKLMLAAMEKTGCVIAAPDYTCSTDAPYPAAIDDCYTALVWLRDHAADYGARNDKLMVAGESAGGGLTAALCLRARDTGEVSVAFHAPLYPMLDDRMTSESMRDNDAPVWDEQRNRIAWQLYLGDLFETDAVPVYAAPGRAEDLTGMPPALTFIGDIDPFRDETYAYFERLRAVGIDAVCRTYEGCYHGFDQTGHSAIARRAITTFAADFADACGKYTKPQPHRNALR